MPGKNKKIKAETKDIWIYPDGGLTDMLILSGVLKQCLDLNPDSGYNLVRRAALTGLLTDHPAIQKIDFPPKSANILTTGYWSKEKTTRGSQRPYQRLAGLFGLKTPVEENLYLPGNYPDDRLLMNLLPADMGKLAVIAPSSVYPRKMMSALIWQDIADKLKNRGIFVIQTGLRDDIYIKGAYSLLGMTTPLQLISLLSRSDVIISVDNFIMHAAHLVRKPAIIVWGPTDSQEFGYSEQVHIRCSTDHCELRDKCLVPDFPDNCKTSCPLKNRHCLDMVPVDKIIKSVTKICFS